jgi:hypothetical protein
MMLYCNEIIDIIQSMSDRYKGISLNLTYNKFMLIWRVVVHKSKEENGAKDQEVKS